MKFQLLWNKYQEGKVKLGLEMYLLNKYKSLFPPEEIRVDETKCCLAFGFECNAGWHELLDDCFSQLLALNEDIKIAQVKEKFGALRIYIDGGSDEAFAIIDRIEKQSLLVCEICGKPGSLRSEHHWLSTRCEECFLTK
jgi:hypothetical protein